MQSIFLFCILSSCILFYSPDCPHCEHFLKILPKIETLYNIKVQKLSLDSDVNLMLLDSLESTFPSYGKDELPILFYRDTLFCGEQNVKRAFAYRKMAVSGQKKCRTCKRTETDRKIRNVHGEVVYFYETGCRKCEKSEWIINALRHDFPAVIFKSINIYTHSGRVWIEKVRSIADTFAVPSVLVGDSLFYGKDLRYSSIYKYISKNKAIRIKTVGQNMEGRIEKEFGKIGIAAIMGAGLIDGINPCAFAVLIFLLSFLSYSYKNRKMQILVLCFYTTGVFLCYFLLGIGALGLIEFISRSSVIRLIIKAVFIGITGVFAVVSMYDFLKAKQGRAGEMRLVLPDKYKRLIHKIIRKGMSGKILSGVMLTGFVVSCIELACTGQIYLPTITYVVTVPHMRLRAVSYLLIYNLMFIIPLVIIGIASIFVENEVFLRLLKRNIAGLKLSMFFVFLFLSVLIYIG